MLNMATINYTIPKPNNNDVCLFQSLLTSGTLLINGLKAVNNIVSYYNDGYCRQIKILNSSNFTGEYYLVTGSQNGTVICEKIKGKSSNIPTISTNFFDEIYSIYCSNSVTNITVGSANNVYINSIPIENASSIPTYTITLTNNDTTHVNCQIYGSTVLLNSVGLLNMQAVTYNNIAFKLSDKTIINGTPYIYNSQSLLTQSVLIYLIFEDSINSNFQISFVQ